MAELTCIVVTPEQTVRETPADFVAVTLFDGEIGIGPGHTPLIGRLGYGEMRIRHGSQVERFYVEGGFVEVVDNVVSLLDQSGHSRRQDRRAGRLRADGNRPQPGGPHAGTHGRPPAGRGPRPGPVAAVGGRSGKGLW